MKKPVRIKPDNGSSIQTGTLLIKVVSATLLLTSLSCRSTHSHPDAVTRATPKYKPGKVMLPPASSEYKVLGEQPGLQGFVVQYSRELYRGGNIYDDSAAETLKSWEIKTIISVTPTQREREFCKANSIKLVELPFEKTKGPDTAELDLLLETLKNNSDPIYLHCHGGTHRGGSLGVFYRMHMQGWTYEKAVIEYGRLGGDLMGDHVMLETVHCYIQK